MNRIRTFGFSMIEVLVVIAMIVICVVGFGYGCRGLFADQGAAVRALENAGYSDVRITGSKWLLVSMRGCSNSDAARFDATAINPAGRRVSVYACVGWPFKGATVRSD